MTLKECIARAAAKLVIVSLQERAGFLEWWESKPLKERDAILHAAALQVEKTLG